jgi:hypothetical protein
VVEKAPKAALVVADVALTLPLAGSPWAVGVLASPGPKDPSRIGASLAVWAAIGVAGAGSQGSQPAAMPTSSPSTSVDSIDGLNPFQHGSHDDPHRRHHQHNNGWDVNVCQVELLEEPNIANC